MRAVFSGGYFWVKIIEPEAIFGVAIYSIYYIVYVIIFISLLLLKFYTSGPAFNYLDSAPARCSGADVPVPYAKSLEELAFPQAFNVVNSVKKVLGSKLS